MARTAISIQSVSKNFQNFKALSNISFDINEGEFFTLLGPSGCGKTTLLRLLAGFEATSSGSIQLFGEDISNKRANQRPINTVFQHYALFPHLNIRENVEFGLKMLGVSTKERSSRAEEMLQMVQLSEFADRTPAQLSGGQQQRVALARALAPRPKLLLLDEPLSALDLKLRQSMRFELKRIQQQTGITFVFVTHDQEEALTMSDRIAVMSAGNLQQIGTPNEIYERPENKFVANFIGETNLLPVRILDKDKNKATIRLKESLTTYRVPYNHELVLDENAIVSIRPERITLQQNIDSSQLNATINQVIYMGTDTQYVMQLQGGEELLVRTQNSNTKDPLFKCGQTLAVTFDMTAAQLLRE